MNYWVIIGVSSSALIIGLGFLFSVFFVSRDMSPMPLFINQRLNESLFDVLTEVPPRRIALVTGMAGSGKSALINHTISQMKETRFVVSFDASLANSVGELKELINLSITKGLMQLKHQKQLNFSGLISLIDRNITFADFIDSVHGYHPIVVVENADYFFKLLDWFMDEMVDAVRYIRGFVPFVFEIKDTTRIIDAPSFATVIDTREMIEDMSVYVNSKKFSRHEVLMLQRAFGPHPGFIKRVYEDTKYGIRVQDAIERVSSSIQYPNCTFPQHLCRKMVVESMKSLKEAEPFIEQGIVGLTHNYRLVMPPVVYNHVCSK